MSEIFSVTFIKRVCLTSEGNCPKINRPKYFRPKFYRPKFIDFNVLNVRTNKLENSHTR